MRIVAWQVDLREPSATSGVDGIRSAVGTVSAAVAAHGVEMRSVTTDAEARALTARLLRVPEPDRLDVVHLHSVFRPKQDAIAELARRRRVPYVVSPHSALAAPALARQARRKAGWIRLVGRRMLEGAAAVCCLSAQEEAEVVAAAPGCTTTVVRNAVPPRPPGAGSWRFDPDGGAVMVGLSRWDVRQKGLDVLADIARHQPGLCVVVHGAQDKNEPAATARLMASAPANFELRPPVFGAAKDATLRSARLFVMTSRWEGLSMSLLEALALGVPVAVSRYVARTVPVVERDLGLVLDDDPLVAARQLQAVVHDRSRLEAWSRAGRAWVEEQCSAAAVGAALADTYRSTSAREVRGGVAAARR